MSRKLTTKQAKFVKYVLRGMPQGEAAEAAEYAHPAVDASRLMRLPHVRDALHEARTAEIEGDLSVLAMDTIRALMDQRTPAATRYKAATWVLGQAGHREAGQLNREDVPLEDMTPEQLAQAVQSGMSALQDLAGQLDGHHIIDGQPRPVRDITPAADDLSFLE